MSNLYWVGSRESDIAHAAGLFGGSVTLYGTGERSLTVQKRLRIDNNAASAERDRFVLKNIAEIARREEDALFCFYDPSWAYEIEGLDRYFDRFVCVNDREIYARLSDKINFYREMKDRVPMGTKYVLKGKECGYDDVCKLFGVKKGNFIVQAPVANGGEGTFCLFQNNKKRVAQQFKAEQSYLVSAYYEKNVPVNVHFVITENGELMFPGSIQILRKENDKLIYRGADYAAYKTVEEGARERFERYARTVAQSLRHLGYRGVCGIDGMIVGEEVYIVEANLRFQGSTAVLNKALEESGLPSVQAINLAAFENRNIVTEEQLLHCAVDYSTYSYLNTVSKVFGNHILANAERDENIVEIDRDGYDFGSKINKNRYMFRILIKGNITCVNADGGIYVHENVVEPDKQLYAKVRKKDRLALKISLMTLGVKLQDEARNYLLANGGIRPGNNNAVDINLLQMVVNAPCDIKFISLAPFEIRLNAQNKLELFYYDECLTEVKLYPLDTMGEKITSRGVPYSTVAYLSTDRLRVHMTHECIFKRQNTSCKFCNIVPCKDPISLDDIQEVVYDYIDHSPAVKHFLVGGQSMDQNSGMKRITEIVRIIRSKTKTKRIYVMALPYNEESIKALVDAGMNELACNIEIFDEKLARLYMPGKGAISRSTYFRVLSYAHQLLPETGSVRAMLIYGLEPEKSFLKGIRKLTALGIQPIISIFRPLPDTPLENLIAPPLVDVYNLYRKTEAICERNGLRLGPACVFCQNNTLSLPEKFTDLILD